MNDDPIDRAIAHFNAESYRDALLAFEERWFTERSDFWKALIQLSNALLQLRLGLVSGPRRTLASASELLAQFAPQHAGFDVAALQRYVATVRAAIPDGIETGGGSVPWVDVPRLQLVRHEADA